MRGGSPSCRNSVVLLHQRLAEAVGQDAVLTAPEDLAAYAFDAYTDGNLPAAVVLPASTREVSAVVRVARDLGVAIVPRGAGTGLCGGAVPIEGGVVISDKKSPGKWNSSANRDPRTKSSSVDRRNPPAERSFARARRLPGRPSSVYETSNSTGMRNALRF